MNTELEKLYEGYLKADRNDVANVARSEFMEVFKRATEQSGSDDKGFSFAMCVFASFVGQDLRLSDEEWALFAYISQQKMSREDTIKILDACYNNETYALVKQICDHDDEMRKHVLKLGLAVSAIDGNIDSNENDLVLYLLS